MALDLVSFRKDLVRRTRALLGLKLSRIAMVFAFDFVAPYPLQSGD